MEVKNSGFWHFSEKFQVSNKGTVCLWVVGNIQNYNFCPPPSNPARIPLLLPILFIVSLSNILFETRISPVKSNKLENYSLDTKFLSNRWKHWVLGNLSDP